MQQITSILTFIWALIMAVPKILLWAVILVLCFRLIKRYW